jgi:hypothetical protein
MAFRGLAWFLLAQLGAIAAFDLWAWMTFEGWTRAALMVALPLAVAALWVVLLFRPPEARIHAQTLRLTAAGVGLVGAVALAAIGVWGIAFYQTLVSVVGLFSSGDPYEYWARTGY